MDDTAYFMNTETYMTQYEIPVVNVEQSTLYHENSELKIPILRKQGVISVTVPTTVDLTVRNSTILSKVLQ